MFDLKIINGTIVDGTGAASFIGDVAITDGIVVEVGPTIAGDATEVIDATGLVVAPGFVDIHTHYDGQATWDPILDPSASHGVTTVVVGNCGVGFAPVRPGKEGWLVELMEGVEDIPGTALHEGIQWSWETFPQYLDALASREYSMDIAAFVPHAPLRVYVMGDRGALDVEPTSDELSQMAEHVRASIEAGAIGVSTSRSLNHRTLDGELVPGTFANSTELVALAQAMVDAGGGLFEAVPTGETGDDRDTVLGEIALLSEVSKRTGVPVSFLMIQSMGAPDLWAEQLEAVRKANIEGAQLVPQVAGRPGGMLIGVATYHGLMRRPTFRRLESELSYDDLLAALQTPEVKTQILSEENLPEDPNRQYESIADNMAFMFERLFVLGDPPDYEPTRDRSIAGMAEAAGKDPWEVLYDAIAGGALLLGAFTNYANTSQDHLAVMLEHPDTVVGLSDGGAHVRFICDASMPTYLLTHWTRDRTRGRRIPIEAI
ncbi:MAG: amidohydrolase family protein, partial [Actinobacteria bacterium]|nr:amidohydrolase family protein [Actinomycetota bacterium]